MKNKMLLKLVEGKAFLCTCKKCNKTQYAGDQYLMWADLKGKPFEDYYCDDCRKKYFNNQIIEPIEV